MDSSDIKSLIDLGYWPTVVPTKNGKKWRLSIYKKVKGTWNIDQKKLFNNPFKAYEWAIEYLSDIYYAAEKQPYSIRAVPAADEAALTEILGAKGTYMYSPNSNLATVKSVAASPQSIVYTIVIKF